MTMDTENARITRKEAAELVGVSERTINRWSAKGLLGVRRDRQFRKPATYDRAKVIAAATRAGRIEELELPDNPDIST
jgi:phage terminase Nu1 subunit (DNA packaging protein)